MPIAGNTQPMMITATTYSTMQQQQSVEPKTIKPLIPLAKSFVKKDTLHVTKPGTFSCSLFYTNLSDVSVLNTPCACKKICRYN